MRRRAGRTLAAALVALMLMATGALSVWVLATSGLLAADSAILGGPLASGAVADPAPIEVDDGARVLFNAQVSQPRDPFRPLITETSPAIGAPGVGTGDGSFIPDTSVVMLVEIRQVAGVFRATVVVDDISYDVGVGDTFAGVYKVVSLSEDSGVFMFGDNVFTLDVGQQILK